MQLALRKTDCSNLYLMWHKQNSAASPTSGSLYTNICSAKQVIPAVDVQLA
jgi:hypothetical protein